MMVMSLTLGMKKRLWGGRMLEDLKKLAGKKFVGAGNDVGSLRLVFMGCDEQFKEKDGVVVEVPYSELYSLTPEVRQAFDTWGKACEELVAALMVMAKQAQGVSNEEVGGGGCCGGSSNCGDSFCNDRSSACFGGGCSGNSDCGRSDGCVPPSSSADGNAQGNG